MTTTFLQSAINNPYQLYDTMLSENPIYWDETNKLWAIYSFEGCKAILNSDLAHIPTVDKNGLNEHALLIIEHLARLNNGVRHEIAKHSAKVIFDKMKIVNIKERLENALNTEGGIMGLDWVNSISKKLPIMIVLHSFDFKKDDFTYISSQIEQLVKIMLPHKTPEQVLAINKISKKVYEITEKHILQTSIFSHVIIELSEKYHIETDKTLSYLVSNLIGLFIQSYDAGRGVLSNSFLQVQNNRNSQLLSDKTYFEKSVIETLRFDPPIHNTRRIADADIEFNNFTFKKGQSIFIMLAAANRDPNKFEKPQIYNIERINNNENLTFGSGGHLCLAKHFSIHLTVEILFHFFQQYPKTKILNKKIEYEPSINARLPKQILVSLK